LAVGAVVACTEYRKIIDQLRGAHAAATLTVAIKPRLASPARRLDGLRQGRMRSEAFGEDVAPQCAVARVHPVTPSLATLPLTT